MTGINGAGNDEEAWSALKEAYTARQTEYVIEYGRKPVVNVKKALKAAGIRAGVHCSPHVFRHTAGVRMVKTEISTEKISQYMPHTTVRTTERHYARFSAGYIRDASEALIGDMYMCTDWEML